MSILEESATDRLNVSCLLKKKIIPERWPKSLSLSLFLSQLMNLKTLSLWFGAGKTSVKTFLCVCVCVGSGENETLSCRSG